MITIVAFQPFGLDQADFLNLLYEHGSPDLIARLRNRSQVDFIYLGDEEATPEGLKIRVRDTQADLLILYANAFTWLDPWIEEMAKIKTILMCGWSPPDKGIRFWAAGAREVFCKPDEFAAFTAELEKCLAKL
jgi:hypothetical protein